MMTVKDVVDAIAEGRNITVPLPDFYEMAILSPSYWFANKFMGRPVAAVPGGIVIFSKCNHCGSTDREMETNLLGEQCCVHCGAPIK